MVRGFGGLPAGGRHARQPGGDGATGFPRAVIRLALAPTAVWRFRRDVSPLASSLWEQLHAAPDHEAPTRGAAGRELQLVPAASVPPQLPGADACRHAQNAKILIEEHDVDGKSHANRVNAPERIGQQEPGLRVDPVTPEQATDTADTERRRDVNTRHEHLLGLCIDQFLHAAIVQPLEAPSARRRVAGCDALRVHCAPRARHCDPLLPLRYAPRMLCEDFHSGDDVTLRFLGRTYSFARKDFEQRVLRAAIDLDLAAKPVSRGERADVVQAAIVGCIDEPRSEVGERIAELQARGGEDPVYWLRKLVFRSAWLDHRIKHGQVDVAYDDNVGAFRIEPGKYPLPGSGHPSFAVSETSA